MATDNKSGAIRKRQQIENASRSMFVWVAIAAVVVGAGGVVAVSLFERISFNQQLINDKNQTAANLEANNKIVDDLKANLRVINTNEALSATPRLDNSEPVSVVLDALPAAANSSALGASLQQKLLLVSGVTVDSLTVDPISGVENSKLKSKSRSRSVSSSKPKNGEITFKFVVSTDANQISSLKKVLANIERSIRVIDLTSVTIEQRNNKATLTAEGRAFYHPETQVELVEKPLSPQSHSSVYAGSRK